MSTHDASYRAQVETQKEEILTYLAQLGISNNFAPDIPPPRDESPLAEIVYALRLVAENLTALSEQRDQALQAIKERIAVIQQQSQAILELSTPVINIWNGVLVCPLIGTIDTQRAQQILEGILDATINQQAGVVIIDITGVPVVDTAVANHLKLTVAALRLVGAEPILTGVRAAVAISLTRIGVDLTRVTTRGTLKHGLHTALQLTGQRIVSPAQDEAGLQSTPKPDRSPRSDVP